MLFINILMNLLRFNSHIGGNIISSKSCTFAQNVEENQKIEINTIKNAHMIRFLSKKITINPFILSNQMKFKNTERKFN